MGKDSESAKRSGRPVKLWEIIALGECVILISPLCGSIETRSGRDSKRAVPVRHCWFLDPRLPLCYQRGC